MKNIDIKKLGWRTFLIFWNLLAIIGLFVVSYFLYIVFDDEGYCISEQHGVWDDEQKICRHDCIKWNKELGCIKQEHTKE